MIIVLRSKYVRKESMENTALQKTRGKKKEKKIGGERKISIVVKTLVKDKSN